MSTVVLGSATATRWHVIDPLSQQALTGAELPHRFISASAFEEIVTAQAFGDRHMTNVTVKKVEMLMTGYPTRICASTTCNGR